MSRFRRSFQNRGKSEGQEYALEFKNHEYIPFEHFPTLKALTFQLIKQSIFPLFLRRMLCVSEEKAEPKEIITLYSHKCSVQN